MPKKNHTINFKRFIALGDSITAGYADGVLSADGQRTAYPALLATQYHGSSTCVQPRQVTGLPQLVLVPDTQNPRNKWGKLAIQHAIAGDQNPVHPSPGTEAPFYNLAVPGAKTAHLLAPGYGDPAKGAGNYNPFFAGMAADPRTSSVLEDALNLNPSFFTLLIGNNDLLAYAMTGGTGEQLTPLDGPPGTGFEASFRYVVAALCQQGAQGVLATLPDLSSIPFFNTIPFNALLLEKAEAENLNALHGGSGLTFRTGVNAFLADGASDASKPVRLNEGDLVLTEVMLDVRRQDYLCGRLPIPKRYYLNREEVNLVKAAIRDYNNVITQVAGEYGLGLVQLDRLLERVQPDRLYDARARAIRYFETGTFSLDGIHINPLGQALLANEFVKCIQRHYGLKIPRLPILHFRKKQGPPRPIKSYF